MIPCVEKGESTHTEKYSLEPYKMLPISAWKAWEVLYAQERITRIWETFCHSTHTPLHIHMQQQHYMSMPNLETTVVAIGRPSLATLLGPDLTNEKQSIFLM